MPARKTGRAKFDFRGRPFVWWVDRDLLRVSSLDKKFVIACPLRGPAASPLTLSVIGTEFPGLDRAEPRPVRLAAPELSGPLGACVHQLLSWSFDPNHRITRTGPPARDNPPLQRTVARSCNQEKRPRDVHH